MFIAALQENYVQYISDYQGVPFVLWTNDHLSTHQRDCFTERERGDTSLREEKKGR